MGSDTGNNQKLSSVGLFLIRENLQKERGLWIYAIRNKSGKSWYVKVLTQLKTLSKEVWLENWSAGNFSTALEALEYGVLKEIKP